MNIYEIIHGGHMFILLLSQMSNILINMYRFLLALRHNTDKRLGLALPEKFS
jgi:hypothetical protein